MIFLRTILVLSALVFTSAAKADACTDAINAEIPDFNISDGCTFAKDSLIYAQRRLAKSKNADRVCGLTPDGYKSELEQIKKWEARVVSDCPGGNKPANTAGPSRGTSDPKTCINERVTRTSNGNYAYNYSNGCSQVVTFDIDSCDPGPSFEVLCKVTPITLASKGANQANTNYRREPKARNFR